VPWPRRLVAGLSPLRTRFITAAIHVEFVVNKAAMRQDFLRFLRFFLGDIIPPWLSIIMDHLKDEQ
jgi:hypothetical protein